MPLICNKIKKTVNRLLQPLFDLSLFWKVGIVIGTCVIVNTLIALNFFDRFNTIKSYLENEPFYSYKSLAQEGLLIIKGLAQWDKSEAEKAVELTHLRELAWIGLKGGVYECNGTEVVRIYRVIHDKALQVHLERIRDLSNEPLGFNATALTPLKRELEAILHWAIDKEDELNSELKALSGNMAYFYMVLLVILALFLVWGALAFLFMVKRPLDNITHSIKRLFWDQNKFCEDPDRVRFTYYANDEIGRLAKAVDEVIQYYGEMACFRHLIEEDQDLDDVLEHLGNVFERRLGFSTFAIYQVSNSQNTMQCVYLSPPDLEINPEKLINANICRAKRTGHPVSSIEQPEVCKVFLWNDEADHYCIPFMSGGSCVGLVQFIIPKSYSTRVQKNVIMNLKLAERYIQEAVPVIEAKRYAKGLRDQALKDPLTGLYNRRFLGEALDNIVAGVLRRKSCMGILMGDLDHFKSVNDRYGHDVGDKVLKETARILKSGARASDLVCRFGGEEFLILLMDIHKDDAKEVAEKLRARVEAHKFETPQGIIRRTISIGVSEFPVDSDAVWETIKFADVALYKAKEMGRNRVVRFTKDMWEGDEY